MLIRLGTHYGGWVVNPDRIDSTSVVYSAGIGEDISFDLALINRTGCKIYGFDPTPRCIEWIRKRELPRSFVFHEYGLAGTDGLGDFYPPENRDWVSHSIFSEGHRRSDVIQVAFKKLSTVMRELGHTSVDLLKMDIEGAEYDVLHEILEKSLLVDQVAVELHKVEGHDVDEMIQALSNGSYVIAAADGDDYLFLRGE